jgi:hypothetical protein
MIHFGTVGLRSACGMVIVRDDNGTDDKRDVECARCRDTLIHATPDCGDPAHRYGRETVAEYADRVHRAHGSDPHWTAHRHPRGGRG